MTEDINPNEQSEFFKTLSNLFGVRWDTIFKWVVAAYASAWFWMNATTTMMTGRSFRLGPIDWGVDVSRSLGVAVPGWIPAIAVWLKAPEHSWFVALLPLIAATAGICLVKAQRSSGLTVVSIIALLLSIQASESIRPVFSTVLLAGLPTMLALIRAVSPPPGWGKHKPRPRYRAGRILIGYAVVVLSPIWQVVFAPFLAFGLLVAAYD